VSVFFTSDWHLNHDKILEYAKRPFGSIEQMNEVLIESYNESVRSSDTVFFVGDMGFGKAPAVAPLVQRLRGRKILVRGNHDRISTNKLIDMGFADVVKKHALHKLGDRLATITHFPKHPNTFGTEFVIHGHTHSKSRRAGPLLHVGVDAWYFCPVPEELLLQLVKDYDREASTSPLPE
jgi:calcineurin-like phosphoesterase family protein